MNLTKDGITLQIFHPTEIKRYKALGFREEAAKTEAAPVPAAKEVPAPPALAPAPEQLNKEAVAEVNKPDKGEKAPKSEVKPVPAAEEAISEEVLDEKAVNNG